MVGLGFDVNARAGRGQSFVTGATALHAAASDNDVDVVVVRALLSLGADPDARDDAFHGTPPGWARYGDAHETVVVLEAVAGRPDPA